MTTHLLPVPIGLRVANPFNGETFIFTHVEEVPEFAQFDVHIAPGGMLTGTGMHHVHPCADEEFIVRTGTLVLSINGLRQALHPGESFLVRRGTPHHFRNGHAGETLFTCRFTPGHQYLRFFLNMALGTKRHPERYDQRGEPPLVLRALALHAYAGHAYTSALPIWLQRALFALLAPIARLKGYGLDVPPLTLRRRRT